jgi:hypothetical protein
MGGRKQFSELRTILLEQYFSFPAPDLPSLYSILRRPSPWRIAILRSSRGYRGNRHHGDRMRDLMRTIVTGRVPRVYMYARIPV